MDKKYIRLTTEGVTWKNTVAEVVREQRMGPNLTRMFVFKGPKGSPRVVPAAAAIFITEQEFFKGVLQGMQYNG